MALSIPYIPDLAMDAALDYIADADQWHMCVDAPDDYDDVTNHSKGYASVDSGDFTKANGDVSGRKLTIGAQSITASGDGTVNCMVLVKSTSSLIKAIVACESKAVVTSSSYNTNAADIYETNDPS